MFTTSPTAIGNTSMCSVQRVGAGRGVFRVVGRAHAEVEGGMRARRHGRGNSACGCGEVASEWVSGRGCGFALLPCGEA